MRIASRDPCTATQERNSNESRSQSDPARHQRCRQRLVDAAPRQGVLRLTLDQFREAVKPSVDVRVEIADLEGRLQAALARRDTSDTASSGIMRRVVNAVKGDPEEGEDGELYAAMGYVRKSERSSGLTRRRGADTTKKIYEAA
jgi:hypothetical protein